MSQNFKEHPKFLEALRVCGDFLGEISEDKVFESIEDPAMLVDAGVYGYHGIILDVPGQELIIRKIPPSDGRYSVMLICGSPCMAPTAVNPDWDGPVRPCRHRDYGFYWITKATKPLETYVRELKNRQLTHDKLYKKLRKVSPRRKQKQAPSQV